MTSNAPPAGYARAARLDALAPGELLAIDVAGARVCVGRLGDAAAFALHDECSHARFRLSEGELTGDDTIECAWHGARFDCRTGAVRRGPATDPVPAYDVLVHDGEIYVRPRTPR